MEEIIFWCFLLAGISPVFSSCFDNGGWTMIPNTTWLTATPVCNIVIEDGSLSLDTFLSKYAYNVPVIIRNATNNEKFQNLCSKHNLMSNYGDLLIRLSSSNSYSYEKHDVSLTHYLNNMISPRLQPNSFANETFYFFGDMLTDELNEILVHYKMPPYTLPKTSPILSFGIAGAGTGVPFHFHGPGFGEVIYGRKHWFLYPPEMMPSFNPDETTLHWYLHNYSKLSHDMKPLECTIGPGEAIFFPDHWWHATLNLDTSIFISTFLGPP